MTLGSGFIAQWLTSGMTRTPPTPVPSERVTAVELENRFTYHPPKPEQTRSFTAIRAAAHYFAQDLVLEVPESRELNFALERFEEAVMWANAGIARRS